ncbi:hypothetical protein CCR94_22055 [Rhodoblastus sphagnicola]|uniref:HdeD protein n=1 Tax=Rhodoblastus sphagnicola TaxID=333368 RepID=A0A2S6MWB2_9HYPH|nr:DUF308 domain-containing protein [Rhodoblastus sphagnicola]MBB4196689.1 uncharacterized membrane protein HdeD (DUF308 family) [Rhodoblastus sphagnicola]PPQ26650.1 hypothetical protein CCR94_22055 [Rhodoblastus sphagnicola]
MSLQQPTLSSERTETLTRSMHDHWKLFLAEGIILCVLGLGAIVLPLIAGLATTVLLGWLFLIAGLLGLVFTFKTSSAPGFGWSILSAAAAIIAGALLLWDPLQGLATLTFVLVAYFIVDGAAIIFLAIGHRRQMSGQWAWMLMNGVTDLILAGIIVSGFPGTLVWALGLLVGIDLLFGGVALIAMALAARKGVAKG